MHDVGRDRPNCNMSAHVCAKIIFILAHGVTGCDALSHECDRTPIRSYQSVRRRPVWPWGLLRIILPSQLRARSFCCSLCGNHPTRCRARTKVVLNQKKNEKRTPRFHHLLLPSARQSIHFTFFLNFTKKKKRKGTD